MANLSNINGKFVVEQTTGYVGVGTTDPSYPIEVLNASAEIALNASGGSIYRVQSDSASNFIIRKAGVGDRLVINSAGNATFAGDVVSNAIVQANGFRTTTGSTDYSLLTRNSSNTAVYIQQAGSGNILDVRYGSQAAGQGTSAFAVNSSGNSTFAGNIAMGDNDITGIDQLIFTSGTYLTDISSNYVELRYASTAAGGMIIMDGDGTTQGYLYADGGATSNFGLLHGSGSWAVRCKELAEVELRYNDSVKFATTSTGVTVTGALFVNTGDASGNRMGLKGDGATTGTALHTNWTTGNSYLDFRLGGDTDTYTKMRITNTGNVGIGTVLPASVLHIKDNTAGPTQLSIQSNDFTRAEEINFLNPSTSAISGQIKYYTNPTVEYMSFSTSNNSATVERMRITNLGRVVIGGGTASANTLTLVGSAVELDIHNTSGKRWRFNADTSGNLKFEDKTGGTEAMRIASDGNVGIGTTSVAEKLEVSGSVKIGNMKFEPANGGRIGLNRNTSNGVIYDSNYPAFQINGAYSTADFLEIQNYASTGGFLGSVVLKNGNFGIGTDSPGKPLQIGGSAPWIRLQENSASSKRLDLWVDNGVGYIGANQSAQELAFQTGSSNRINILNNGNVGIQETAPATRMQINGCLGIGSAVNDGNITRTFTNFSQQDGGSLHINIGLGGGSSSGDTITFEYAALSWKSWSLVYNFASTSGIAYGVAGGYWNNSGGSTNQTQQNNLGVSVAITHNGQSNLITFTFTNLGTHAMANFVYMQAGGDGQPKGSRVTITANS